MAYENIKLDIDGPVGVVTLNRPDKLNAFSFDMDKEFADALWTLERDESIRVIVITGEGKAFCSGFDLSGGGAAFGADAHEEHNESLGESDESITDRYPFWKFRTPVIAAINGHAIGAGLTLTFLMDFRFVAEEAKLRLPFVRLGVIPDANVTWLLPRLVGLAKATELLLWGDFFTGAQAVEWGLATRSVPRDELMPTVMAFAHELATNTSPVSTAVTKQLLYRFLETNDRETAFTLETKATWWAGSQPDTMTGVTAVMTRQTPEWKQSKTEQLPDELLKELEELR